MRQHVGMTQQSLKTTRSSLPIVYYPRSSLPIVHYQKCGGLSCNNALQIFKVSWTISVEKNKQDREIPDQGGLETKQKPFLALQEQVDTLQTLAKVRSDQEKLEQTLYNYITRFDDLKGIDQKQVICGIICGFFL